MSPSSCKACSGEWPREDHFIADCGRTKAYLHEDQFFTGWTVLVLKRHATELFHLSRDERACLIEEVAFVADGLAEEFHAVKINYELLGNQLPHIHWHLIPRLATDPHRLEPVWRIAHEPRPLSSGEHEDMMARLRIRFAGGDSL
jgi:diadenosine tetraphosphate (Ap4A) HIT family hydrolase